MNHRDEILAKIGETTLPPLTAQVVERCFQPDTGTEETLRLLEAQPELAERVLALLETAHFGSGDKTRSLSEIATHLSSTRLKELTAVSSLIPLLQVPVHQTDMRPYDLVRHSVAVAVGVEILAETLAVEPPEFLFLTGIVHDIGRVMLDEFGFVFATEIVAEVTDSEISYVAAERSVRGIDHGEVGALLLENWGFSPSIVQTVHWHHEPQPRAEDILRLDLINMADMFVLMMGIGTGDEGLYYPVSQKVEQRLAITEEITEEVIGATQIALEQLEPVFLPAGDE